MLLARARRAVRGGLPRRLGAALPGRRPPLASCRCRSTRGSASASGSRTAARAPAGTPAPPGPPAARRATSARRRQARPLLGDRPRRRRAAVPRRPPRAGGDGDARRGLRRDGAGRGARGLRAGASRAGRRAVPAARSSCPRPAPGPCRRASPRSRWASRLPGLEPPRGAAAGSGAPARSGAAGPGSADAGWTLHAARRSARGRQRRAALHPRASRSRPSSTVAPLGSRRTRSTPTASAGSAYGPAFQGVDQVWRRDGEALARLSPTESGESRRGRYRDPPRAPRRRLPGTGRRAVPPGVTDGDRDSIAGAHRRRAPARRPGRGALEPRGRPRGTRADATCSRAT